MNINVNSTQADSALALLPMFVPGALTSVQPTGFAHLGVPLVIYPAPTGLAMVIDPVTTLSTTLAAFDTVVVWLNGQPTSAIKIIQPGEENDRILMYLPPALLVNGINTMFYRVTRPSGNFEDSTPILNVLFNNPAPNISVSHPASIGPGQPAVITLTVGYARPYDTVTLSIGTWSITFTNPDPTKSITHTLTAAELQQIGDGTHPVSARVIDQLTNSNVSPTTSITITANQKVYNPPIIVQAEPGKILDVAALNGKDATIHGLIWTAIAAGQQVWLKLTGQKPDGSTVTLQIWNGGASQVNATWVSQGFWPKPLPASFLALLADASSLLLEFWVSEDKSNNFATATKFPDQVYTVNAAAAVVVAFLNGPYTAPAGGQLGDIELSLTQNGQPIVGIIKVTLPQGTTFADGAGTKDFTTGVDGKVTINGVTAGSVQGVFSITASSSETTVSAELSIRPPDLAIDMTEMKLDGTMVVNPYGWPTNEMPGNTATRIARGGKPPYSYMSANTQVAQVVSSSGKVTGLKNGITTITVTDAANQRVSYSVRVSNVYRLLVNNALLTAEEGRAWIQSVGGVNSNNIIAYASLSLVNPVRDLCENRIYPDPLGSRIYQYVATQVNFLCWNGSYIGGFGLLYGDSRRIRAFACIPT